MYCSWHLQNKYLDECRVSDEYRAEWKELVELSKCSRNKEKSEGNTNAYMEELEKTIEACRVQYSEKSHLAEKQKRTIDYFQEVNAELKLEIARLKKLTRCHEKMVITYGNAYPYGER